MSHPTKSETPKAGTNGASGEKTQSSNRGTFEMNSTVTTPARTINVPFHGAALAVIEHEGQPYTPMKPIVLGMGMAWQPQHKKMLERFKSTITEMVMVAEDGKQRSMTCLPLRKLPGWLNTVSPGKIKSPEVRARVIQYQNECDDVLWKYWNEGLAVNPRAFAANPGSYQVGQHIALAQTERIKLAYALAAQAAAEVQRTVFDAVLNGDVKSWQHSRYLLALTYDRKTNQQTQPWAKALDCEQFVTSFDELADETSEPFCSASDAQLAQIIGSLSKRLEYRATAREHHNRRSAAEPSITGRCDTAVLKENLIEVSA